MMRRHVTEVWNSRCKLAAPMTRREARESHRRDTGLSKKTRNSETSSRVWALKTGRGLLKDWTKELTSNACTAGRKY
jgi:hypothetical protein